MTVAAACSTTTATPPDPTNVTEGSVVPRNEPVRGGTLSVAIAAGDIQLSPAGRRWNGSELQIGRAIYDRLMVRSTSDQPAVELLTKISASANNTLWTLKIRPDVEFHDGTPLTAQSVVANLEAQRRSVVGESLLRSVASVIATDDLTVQVSLLSPWSTFPEVLTTQIGFIASPITLMGGPAIGTGPFRANGFDLSGSLSAVRNENYWKTGLPYLDGVRFVAIEDPALRLTAVEDGSVDFTVVNDPGQLRRMDELAKNSKFAVHEDRNEERPKLFVALNTGRPPFDRLSARRAVAYATNREQLLNEGIYGEGRIARGIVSDTSPWFTDAGGYVFDLQKATDEVKKYQEETGTPLQFILLVPPDPTQARIASLWRVQLAAAGINIVLASPSDSEIGILQLTGQFQAVMQVGFQSPTPDLYEPNLVGSLNEKPAVSPNVTRYANTLVNRAYAEARATNDLLRQGDSWRIVQEQIAVDHPYVVMLQLREAAFSSARVRDVTAWKSGEGSDALGQEQATVSLAQIWLAAAK